MIHRKKQTLLFIFFLILHAQNHCMKLTLTKDIWSDKIIPYLDFKAKDNLGKSCKAFHDTIKPETLVLNKDECKLLNDKEYTDAMLYYLQKDNNTTVKLLFKQINLHPEMKDIISSTGWKYCITESRKTIIDQLKELIKTCTKNNSLRSEEHT